MKKEYEDRLSGALDFANESAEYHVRNYAGGSLMPGDAYVDMPIDERDKMYLGPDAGTPNIYSRIYRSQREKEMRKQGMTDVQIKRRWEALDAIWRREIEARLYGGVRQDDGAEALIREYEHEKAAGKYDTMDERTRGTGRKKGRIVWVIIVIFLSICFIMGALDGAGIINGNEIADPLSERLNQILGVLDRISSESTGISDGADFSNSGGLVIVYGVVIFLIFRWIYKSKKRKKEIPNASEIYTELIPQLIRRRYGEDGVYSHQVGLPSEQMRRLNCFVGRPFTLDGRPLPITGRDLVEGTYKGVPFRSSYEYMEYEYYYEDSDGDRQKKTDKLFGGIVVEIPYRKLSADVLGVRGNSELRMKEIIKGGTDIYSVGQIKKTENENFNLLFTINSKDEENLFYILTPEVMEKLAALYPREKTALHVSFDGDRLYMCISKSEKYMIFDEDKNIKSMKDVEAYLDKYLRMLQEVLDAALLI